jgi:hypothetical protein
MMLERMDRLDSGDGDLRPVDVESGHTQDVTIDSKLQRLAA